MAQVTQELVTKFSFQGNLGKLDDFNAGLGKAITALGAVAAAAGAAGGALFAFVSSTTANLDPMVQLSRETGVAMERIQELGFAASVSGSSAEALQSSLRGLSQRLGEAATGTGEGVAVFERLGIQLRDSTGQVRNVDDVLDDLRRNMDGLSSAERISVANKLGIDSSLVQLLSSTDEQIAGLTERARELGVVTQEQGDAAASFNDALTVLKFGMDSIRNTIAVGFAPQMQALTEQFIDFLVANRELFEGGLRLVGDGLTEVLEVFKRLAPFLAAAVGVFIALKFAAGGFGAVMTLLALPFIKIAAIIVGILLVLDDLIVAFEGGESVIAGFFDEFLGIDIQPILQGITTAFTDMMDGVFKAFAPADKAVKAFFSSIRSIGTGDFKGFIEDITIFFSGMFEYVMLTWEAVVGFFGDLINLAFPGIVDDIKDFFGEAFDWIDKKIEAVVNAFKSIGSFLGIGDEPPEAALAASNSGRMLPGGTASLTQSTNNLNQDININLSAADPAQAARVIRDELQAQIRDTEVQFEGRGGR